MTRLAALFLLGLVAFEITLAKRDINAHKKKFDEFKKKHGRKYKNQRDHDKRFDIFSSNLARIDDHNEDYDSGKQSFKVGVNQFTDMTDAERAQSFGYLPDPDADYSRASRSLDDTHHIERLKRQTVPAAFDYLHSVSCGRSIVTPVKDQGENCGSGWVFSAVAALESFFDIGSLCGGLNAMSEQNLLDCVQPGSCYGGNPKDALQWVKDQQNSRIDTMASYPYEGKKGTTCRYNLANAAPQNQMIIANITRFASGDENALKAAIYNHGPMTAAISVDWRIQEYTSGVYIYDCCLKDIRDMNHAVLIVGWGTDPKQGDYWLIKNSFGTSWGEQGYMRLARNRNNTCGIANENYYMVGKFIY